MKFSRSSVLALLVLAATIVATLGSAYQSYQQQIPNGHRVMRNGISWPGVGHTSSSGGGNRNAFGVDFAASLVGGQYWTPTLCRKDSDGDGQSNGFELGDPDCVWRPGQTPQRTVDISHPGFADSTVAGAASTSVLALISGTILNPNTWTETSFQASIRTALNDTLAYVQVSRTTVSGAVVVTGNASSFGSKWGSGNAAFVASLQSISASTLGLSDWEVKDPEHADDNGNGSSRPSTFTIIIAFVAAACCGGALLRIRQMARRRASDAEHRKRSSAAGGSVGSAAAGGGASSSRGVPASSAPVTGVVVAPPPSADPNGNDYPLLHAPYTSSSHGPAAYHSPLASLPSTSRT